MTYGPVHRLSIPFFGKLESRSSITRTAFVCVAVIVGLGIGYFSYWICGAPSARLQFTRATPVVVKTAQSQITLRQDEFVLPREYPEINTGLNDKLVAPAEVRGPSGNLVAPAEVRSPYRVTEPLDEKGVSITEIRPSTQGNQPDSEDEYSSEGKGAETYSESTQNDRNMGVSWDDPRLDILHMSKQEFSPRFKNPCWYEPLRSATPYKNNAFVLYSPSAKETLAKLTNRWEELFEIEARPKRLRCLPYFMIIGQPKCGSTDLFWKVSKHPDIETPPIKELHWWARNRQGRRFSYTRIIPLDDYVDMFDKPAVQIEQRVFNHSDSPGDIVQQGEAASTHTHVITGEASVSMLWDNNDWMKLPENRGQQEPAYVNPHYLRHLIPDVKLIVILRDPVERMYSDYLYFHASDKSADDFHKAVKYAISCYHNCTQKHTIRHCVYSQTVTNMARIRLRVGLYSVFMKDWFRVFPRQQFYILRLEDYSKDSLKYIKQIYQFLELRDITAEEEDLILDSPISNVRKSGDRELGGMHEATRKLLKAFYRPFNIELAKLLQDKKYLWLDKG